MTPLKIKKKAPITPARPKFLASPFSSVLHRNGDGHALLVELSAYLPGGAYIAGGALTRMFSGDKSTGDIDVWVPSQSAYDALKAYVSDFPPVEWEVRGGPSVKMQDESYELTDGGEITTFSSHNMPSIQLIGTNFYPPEDQVSRFDFACCQMALVRQNGVLTLLHGEHAIDDATNKVIRIMNNESPRRTGQRVAKYLAKGFTFVGAETKAAR